MDLNEAWSLCGCEMSIQTLPMVTNKIGEELLGLVSSNGRFPIEVLKLLKSLLARVHDICIYMYIPQERAHTNSLIYNWCIQLLVLPICKTH